MGIVDMHNSIVAWDQKARQESGTRLEAVEDFNARGMRRVYGRGDYFGRRTLNLDLWRARDGRLLARFWSRSNEVDCESWAVIGGQAGAQGEQQVPQCLRDEYEIWATANI